jgi:thioredoxin 1
MNDKAKFGASARRALILGVLALAVVAALVLKGGGKASTATTPPAAIALPRLLDLGADKCVPCKMMAPILVELRSEYAGRFEVVFIDVWKDEAKAQNYGLRVIPTQIFFDADGKELKRHEGFFGKEDILAAWRELGYDFSSPPES